MDERRFEQASGAANPCERFAMLMDEFRRGELEGEARAFAESHAATCAACAAELQAAEELGAMLRAAPPPGEAPERYFERLQAAMRARAEAEPLQGGAGHDAASTASGAGAMLSWVRRPWALAGVATGAAALFALFVVLRDEARFERAVHRTEEEVATLRKVTDAPLDDKVAGESVPAAAAVVAEPRQERLVASAPEGAPADLSDRREQDAVAGAVVTRLGVESRDGALHEGAPLPASAPAGGVVSSVRQRAAMAGPEDARDAASAAPALVGQAASGAPAPGEGALEFRAESGRVSPGDVWRVKNGHSESVATESLDEAPSPASPPAPGAASALHAPAPPARASHFGVSETAEVSARAPAELAEPEALDRSFARRVAPAPETGVRGGRAVAPESAMPAPLLAVREAAREANGAVRSLRDASAVESTAVADRFFDELTTASEEDTVALFLASRMISDASRAELVRAAEAAEVRSDWAFAADLLTSAALAPPADAESAALLLRAAETALERAQDRPRAVRAYRLLLEPSRRTHLSAPAIQDAEAKLRELVNSAD